jgi:hypothetical protein
MGSSVVRDGVCCRGPILALVIILLGQLCSTVTAQPQCAYPPDAEGHVSIPSGVTSIGNYAFYGCNQLVSIDIPSSVTSIGNYAFYGCNQLVSIDIPSSVTSIGNYAFNGCTSLATVSIPTSVTSIGVSAFPSCLGFGLQLTNNTANNPRGVVRCIPCNTTHLIIPGNVTSIGDFAFEFCWLQLVSIDIPSSVTLIGNFAFNMCTLLVTVSIPSSVTSIGESAFAGCYKLVSIDLPGSITSIGKNTFYECDSLTTVSLPTGVTSIGDYAFFDCESLTTVSLPTGVTSIGEFAFAQSSLATVSIASTVTSIGYSAFQYCGCPEGLYVAGAQLLNCTNASIGNYSCIAPSGCTATKPGTNGSTSFAECLEVYTSAQGPCYSHAPTPSGPTPPLSPSSPTHTRPAYNLATVIGGSIGGVVAVAVVLGLVWLKFSRLKRHHTAESIVLHNVDDDAETAASATGNISRQRGVFCHMCGVEAKSATSKFCASCGQRM